MTHFNQNKHINTLVVSVLRGKQAQVELQNSINITYGVLDICEILDTENVHMKEIILCLAILSKNSENDFSNIVKKPHNFMRTTRNYKKTQINLRNYFQISQREGMKKSLPGMWVFSAKF